MNGFRDAIQGAGDALQAFAGFLEEHADIIARVIAELPKLIVAYKGFKIAKSVAPFVGAFTSAIAGLAGKGISKIAGKLFGISRGQEEVGKSSAGSSKKILASAKAFVMLGVGVALISGGFFLLAQGAKAVADSGPLAVAVLVGMVGAVIGLTVGMVKMLSTVWRYKTFRDVNCNDDTWRQYLVDECSVLGIVKCSNPSSKCRTSCNWCFTRDGCCDSRPSCGCKNGNPGFNSRCSRFCSVWRVCVLAAAGIAGVLTMSAISLANAGPLAIGVMFGLIVAIGGLMVVAPAVAPCPYSRSCWFDRIRCSCGTCWSGSIACGAQALRSWRVYFRLLPSMACRHL